MRGYVSSPSTIALGRPEAGEGGFGRGDPAQPGTVSGREKIGRAGLAGKKQTAVDRSGEHRAVVGMAGKGEGVRTFRPGILQPGGRGKRRHAFANVVAEEPGKLVDGKGKHRRLPFPLERCRKTPAK